MAKIQSDRRCVCGSYDCPAHITPEWKVVSVTPAYDQDVKAPPEGQKHDAEKLDHTMISNDLLDGLAAVRMFGAKKYQRDNWRIGFKFNRSLAAAYRHINAFKEGEDLDPESGLCHILHAVACLEHLLGDYLHRPHNDDRYKVSKRSGSENKE